MIAFADEGETLFRKLLKLYRGAVVDDYFRFGKWDVDLLRLDTELIATHRQQACAPEPLPLPTIASSSSSAGAPLSGDPNAGSESAVDRLRHLADAAREEQADILNEKMRESRAQKAEERWNANKELMKAKMDEHKADVRWNANRELMKAKMNELKAKSDEPRTAQDQAAINSIAGTFMLKGGSWARVAGTTLMIGHANGDTFRSTLEVVTPTKFRVQLDGNWQTAVLELDGNLHWNDGDVWFRKASEFHRSLLAASGNSSKVSAAVPQVARVVAPPPHMASKPAAPPNIPPVTSLTPLSRSFQVMQARKTPRAGALAQAESSDSKETCKKCGESLEPGDLFCGGCGSQVEESSSRTQESKVQETCKNCGDAYDEGDVFCGSCGVKRPALEAPVAVPHSVPKAQTILSRGSPPVTGPQAVPKARPQMSRSPATNFSSSATPSSSSTARFPPSVDQPPQNSTTAQQHNAQEQAAQEAETVVVTFEPGPLGLQHSDGFTIEEVKGGQALEKGLQVGWTILAVEDRPCGFRDLLFRVRKNGAKPYRVLFAKTFPNEKANAPGSYEILHDGTIVGMTEDVESADVGELQQGTIVDVIQVVSLRNGDRVRGRIAAPLNGWISLFQPSDGYYWARRQAPGEAEASNIADSQPSETTVTFHPGPIGLEHLDGDTVKTIIPGGQAEAQGVRVGLRIAKVNGLLCQSFNSIRFRRATEGSAPYQVTFTSGTKAIPAKLRRGETVVQPPVTQTETQLMQPAAALAPITKRKLSAKVVPPPPISLASKGTHSAPNVMPESPRKVAPPAGSPRIVEPPEGSPRIVEPPAGSPRIVEPPAGSPRKVDPPAQVASPPQGKSTEEIEKEAEVAELLRLAFEDVDTMPRCKSLSRLALHLNADCLPDRFDHDTNNIIHHETNNIVHPILDSNAMEKIRNLSGALLKVEPRSKSYGRRKGQHVVYEKGDKYYLVAITGTDIAIGKAKKILFGVLRVQEEPSLDLSSMEQTQDASSAHVQEIAIDDEGNIVASPPRSMEPAKAVYKIGDRVEMRDREEADWEDGVVTSLSPLRVEGCVWKEVRRKFSDNDEAKTEELMEMIQTCTELSGKRLSDVKAEEVIDFARDRGVTLMYDDVCDGIASLRESPQEKEKARKEAMRQCMKAWKESKAKLAAAATLEKPKKGERRTTLKDWQEQRTILFRPGPIGFFSKAGNVVEKIAEGGQAQCQGVEVGWRVIAVGQQKCTSFRDPIFQEAKKGDAPYKVTFTKAKEQTMDPCANRDELEAQARSISRRIDELEGVTGDIVGDRARRALEAMPPSACLEAIARVEAQVMQQGGSARNLASLIQSAAKETARKFLKRGSPEETMCSPKKRRKRAAENQSVETSVEPKDPRAEKEASRRKERRKRAAERRKIPAENQSMEASVEPKEFDPFALLDEIDGDTNEKALEFEALPDPDSSMSAGDEKKDYINFVVELERNSPDDKLGLDVDRNTLNIFGVRGGIVAAYNDLLINSVDEDKQIQPGDRIIEVNGIGNDCSAMLAMTQSEKISLVIERPKPAAPATAEASEGDDDKFAEDESDTEDEASEGENESSRVANDAKDEDQVCDDSFKIGERVACRDLGDKWHVGTVASLDPLEVKVEGWPKPHRWGEVQKQADDQMTVIATFEPGNVGLFHHHGKVTKVVEGGQGEREGVEVGWRIAMVGDKKCDRFEDKLFLNAKNGKTPYLVMLVKDENQEADIADTPDEKTEQLSRLSIPQDKVKNAMGNNCTRLVPGRWFTTKSTHGASAKAPEKFTPEMGDVKQALKDASLQNAEDKAVAAQWAQMMREMPQSQNKRKKDTAKTLSAEEGQPVNLALQIPGGAESVLKAWYGKSDAMWKAGYGKDVTDRVKELLRTSQPVMASNAFLGDTCMGVWKTLEIQLKEPRSSESCAPATASSKESKEELEKSFRGILHAVEQEHHLEKNLQGILRAVEEDKQKAALNQLILEINGRKARTLMISGIPAHVNRETFIAHVDACGFSGRYSIIQLSTTRSSCGFVQFHTIRDAVEFATVFQGYAFDSLNSKKPNICTVSIAKHQGNMAQQMYNQTGGFLNTHLRRQQMAMASRSAGNHSSEKTLE